MGKFYHVLANFDQKERGNGFRSMIYAYAVEFTFIDWDKKLELPSGQRTRLLTIQFCTCASIRLDQVCLSGRVCGPRLPLYLLWTWQCRIKVPE